MPSDSEGFWGKLSDIWHVLAVAVGVGFAAGGFFGDLWAAPERAQEALDTAEANSRAIDRLHQTVRVIACSREELDQTARMRLNCQEFELGPRGRR